MIGVVPALADADPGALSRLWISRTAVALAVLAGAFIAWRHRRALIRRLTDFLLHPDHALNLACTRIIVFSVIATRFSIEYVAGFAELPREIVRMPIGMGWAAALVPASPEAVATLGTLVRLSAAAAALGLATPLTTWVAALSSCFFFVVPHMFGHVGHDRHHITWFALLLAASPCGDRLAIDAALRALWQRDRERVPDPAARFGFPRRAMLLTMGVAYFFAGFWKLAYAGVDWFRSDNLTNLAGKLDWAGLSDQGAVLAAHPSMVTLGALGTVAFELGFVFAIFSRTGRKIAIAAAFFFHIATYVLLGISFGSLLYCYLGLVDFAGLLRRVGRPARPRGTPVPGTARATFPSRLAYATAAIVVGGNLTFGALRIGNGWPFACYPRFDVLHTPLYTSYVVEGETAAGERVRLHDGELGGPLGRHFYNIFRATQARVGGLEESDGREPRWRALCAFLWRRDARLREARHVGFVLEDVNVRRGEVLGQRRLFDCTPPAGL